MYIIYNKLYKYNMSHITSFLLGTVFGAYISQNYSIPDVKESLNIIIEKIKENEKSKK